ncbi:MAG: NAD-dependent epimerase/dehydratase family protein [Clostridia bacterium]|nr:NAD-dependent epimerase/dehydratase family protein [Clostridia bacterium]
MYKNKKVLLIAGGGTLGTYTAGELLSKGAFVDVICLEDQKSDHERLRYFKSYATLDFLRELFAKEHYDGIVNFIHYKKIEDYKPYHELLIKNTEHLIFLSSYRVYANEQHPITEDAPRLSDVPLEEEFTRVETYALPKILGEDYLRREHAGEPWTIVRPVISFSCRRFDLFMYSGNILDSVKKYGRDGKLLLPTLARDLGAGIDWAGNSGKLIANLLFKKETFGEAYTISTAQNLTWGKIADIYKEVFDIDVEWVDEETFIEAYPPVAGDYQWAYRYDRKFDRSIDNSKVLAATGLTQADFTDITEGLRIERARLEAEA